MMLFRKNYDEGDGGGGATTEVQSQTQDASLESGETGGGGGSEQVTETPEQTVTRLTAELETSKTENSNLATKLGKQSKAVGSMNKLSEMLKKDPKKAIQDLAKQTNVSLKMDEVSAPDIGKSIAEGTVEDVNKAMSENQDLANAQIMQTVSDIVNPIQEQLYANKYEDYDDLKDTRDGLQVAVKSGQMSQTELYHYASRGLHMETALDEYGKKMVQEYKDSLNEKANEHLDGSGSGGSARTENNALFLDDILSQLD